MEVIEVKKIIFHTYTQKDTEDLCEYLLSRLEIKIEKKWIQKEEYIIETNKEKFNRSDFQKWREKKYKKNTTNDNIKLERR